MFVDYAGQTIPIHDAATGLITPAELFVATLGASNYTYAEATLSQQLEDWIGSHVRAFEFFGGVTQLIMPDYVPRNIIRLMFPLSLCARVDGNPAPEELRGRGRQHNRSETLKPMKQGFVVSPNWFYGECLRRIRRRLAGTHGFLFRTDGDFGVPVRGLKAHVPEPASDDIDLDAGFEKMHGCCMAEHVRGDTTDRSAELRGQKTCMAANDLVDAEPGQRASLT